MALSKHLIRRLRTFRAQHTTHALALDDGLTPDEWLLALYRDSDLPEEAKVTAAAMASFMRPGEVVTVTDAELVARAQEIQRLGEAR